MTSEEAAYLEQLGFVPSAFSTSTYVLMRSPGVIDAVVERVPFSYGSAAKRWRARTTPSFTRVGTTRVVPTRVVPTPSFTRVGTTRVVESDDLVALIVMAKLEEIL